MSYSTVNDTFVDILDVLLISESMSTNPAFLSALAEESHGNVALDLHSPTICPYHPQQ
jgi:hypothetical protein